MREAWGAAMGHGIPLAVMCASRRFIDAHPDTLRDVEMSFRRDRMNSTAMRLVLFVLLVATLLGTTGWLSPASAQGAKGAGSRGAAERAAVELKRGTTLDEMQ